MVCGSCGTENPVGTKFCMGCGTRLAASCAACGSPLVPGARFCGECGTTLTGAAAPASLTTPAAASLGRSEAAPVSERRLVTILFADLVGFTPFAEGRDPEEVRDTLSRYFDIAREIVLRYGGTVEKFIGDAVMAVWGAPVARENDPERAVRAALELLAAIPRIGPGITARAGLLTGEASVTLGAIGQGMVAGDLVNTAARLQSVAAPGTVLVGEATMHAAAAAIAFEPAGEHVLKGKAVPVNAWVARRVVAEVGGRGRSEGLEAPFVGRDDELRMLKELFHATSRERRPRLVSAIGPAGIGKSRLAWEFLKYVDGLMEGVWWHQGRSPAYGEGITFWALGEMVRSRCGLLETDDEPTTRAKVTETVARHVPDGGERHWIEPALLALLGSDVPAGGGSEQLFAAWRTFFERMALTDPVVMVFEDLHWADSGTLDFIDHLLDWVKTVPIYVVTLARPELIERRSDWGAGKRQFTSLFVEPLSEPAMLELLKGLVPGLPERARRAIVARADGVPLYAVETVRMLVNDGRLVLRDGAYTPNGDLTELAVPDSLTALIAARLDALAPADRMLVMDASVLGQSFAPAALAAVSGIDQAQLVPRLRALVRLELLTQEADPRSPELGQYAFVQALIREVAYGTLAKRDRKTRHLAAARWFESLAGDELAGALAGHYLAAHANAAEGAETDALAAQARIALRAAADRATSLGAHEQAAAFLRQALTVTNDARETAELLEAAGVAASRAGRHEDAVALLREALAHQDTIGDRHAAAATTAALGLVLLEAHLTEEALALLEPASVAFDDLGSIPAVMRLRGQLARAYMFDERPELAVETADRVLDAAERAHAVDVIADTLVTRGSALCVTGQRYGGLGAIRAGQELANAHGLHGTVLRALNNLAAHGGVGDPWAALDAARAGLAQARRMGERPLVAFLLGNAIENATIVGEWDWIRSELGVAGIGDDFESADRAALLMGTAAFRAYTGTPPEELHADIEIVRASGMPGWEGLQGIVHLVRGEPDAARLQSLAEARSSHLNAPGALLRASRAAIRARRPDAAREDLDALIATGARGPAFIGYHAELGAGIAALEMRTADAFAGFDEALRVYRDLDLPWQLCLAGLTMATVMDPADPAVRAVADEAREIMVRLGAIPFLTQLDALLATVPATPAVERSGAPAALRGGGVAA